MQIRRIVLEEYARLRHYLIGYMRDLFALENPHTISLLTLTG
jgi:hypothetical protein